MLVGGRIDLYDVDGGGYAGYIYAEPRAGSVGTITVWVATDALNQTVEGRFLTDRNCSCSFDASGAVRGRRWEGAPARRALGWQDAKRCLATTATHGNSRTCACRACSRLRTQLCTDGRP